MLPFIPKIIKMKWLPGIKLENKGISTNQLRKKEEGKEKKKEEENQNKKEDKD